MPRAIRLLVAVFVVGFVAACQTQEAEQTGATEEATATIDVDAVRAGIEAANAKWSEAALAADPAALAGLYAEDAILVAPGAPRAEGRAAIEAVFTEMFTKMTFGDSDITIDDMSVAGSGEIAYVVGSYTSPMINADGTTFDDAGTYVAVLKDVDGEWLLAVDTWHSDMAAKEGSHSCCEGMSEGCCEGMSEGSCCEGMSEGSCCE